ncbi:MAG: general secretion pathway protein C [Paraglaciecola sp.]|jgi:general secretion pathway protein C
MTVTHYNLNHIWPHLLKYQQRINRLVVALLCMFLLAYAAQITWRLMPHSVMSDKASTVATIEANQNSGVKQPDLTAIMRLNLFGDLDAQPVVQSKVTDAPPTRLNLTLTGVVTSSVQAQGAAIIENQGNQETYGLGEKILGTNATLKEVYVDRVIIRNNSANETLMLDGLDYQQNQEKNRPIPSPARIRSPSQATQRHVTLSDEALDATRSLQQRPASFTDFIAVSPHRADGELSGYRVSPGSKPELFNAAGLQTGDIITEINGLDLTDMQQSVEAMGELRQAQSLQITVNRGNELLTLYLDLPDAEQEL